MAILDIKGVRVVRFEPIANRTRVRFRFDTGASSQYESISFEFSSAEALNFAQEVQLFLSPDKNPTPPSRAPSGARPKLRIVK
jgi:hypothetical protein